jgi:hypothetical protein
MFAPDMQTAELKAAAFCGAAGYTLTAASIGSAGATAAFQPKPPSYPLLYTSSSGMGAGPPQALTSAASMYMAAAWAPAATTTTTAAAATSIAHPFTFGGPPSDSKRPAAASGLPVGGREAIKMHRTVPTTAPGAPLSVGGPVSSDLPTVRREDLTVRQREIADRVLAGSNAFITGAAGTGERGVMGARVTSGRKGVKDCNCVALVLAERSRVPLQSHRVARYMRFHTRCFSLCACNSPTSYPRAHAPSCLPLPRTRPRHYCKELPNQCGNIKRVHPLM